MSVRVLMADLDQLGIRLEAHGDRLRYSPRSALTPVLADRLKGHKAELLAILRRDTQAPGIDQSSATASWQAALEQLDGDPLFPADLMEALRTADVRWAADEMLEEHKSVPEALGPDGWPADCIDPCELVPCPKCGTLELWQTLAGNWRCLRCDPPTTAPRVAEATKRIHQRNS